MLFLILNEGHHLSNIISTASLEAALTASLTGGILKVILLIESIFIFKSQFFRGGGIAPWFLQHSIPMEPSAGLSRRIPWGQ